MPPALPAPPRPQHNPVREGVPASIAASCPCSEERVFRTLAMLPRSEIDDIISKNDNVNVKCEFCGKRYSMSPADIETELASRE